LTGIAKDATSTRDAVRLTLTKVRQLAPFNEVYGVRRQDYGNCNFIGSSIQM